MTLLRLSNRSKLAKQIDEGWFDWMTAEEREQAGLPSKPTEPFRAFHVSMRQVGVVVGPLVVLPPAIASGLQAGDHVAATTAAFVLSVKVCLFYLGACAMFALATQWFAFNNWHWRPHHWATPWLNALSLCVTTWIAVAWLPNLFIEYWASLT